MSVIALALASIPNRMIAFGFFRQWFEPPMLSLKIICFLMPFAVLCLRMFEQIFNGDDGAVEGLSGILFALFYFSLLIISSVCAVTIALRSDPVLYWYDSYNYAELFTLNMLIDTAAVTMALVCIFCANDLQFQRNRLVCILLLFWGFSVLHYVFGGPDLFHRYVIDNTHIKFLPYIALSVIFAEFGCALRRRQAQQG